MEKNKEKQQKAVGEEYILAYLEDKIKNFLDGDIVDVVFDEDLRTEKAGLFYKGYKFDVQGWIVGDRVF